MMNKSKQLGISLVEVLVATVISLFLLAGIVQVYTGNKATFSFTNALAEVQENGRFAMELIGQDLRLAGIWGCVDVRGDFTKINNTLNGGTVAGYTAQAYDFINNPPIQGVNNNGINNSDELTIRGGRPGQANVRPPFNQNNIAIVDNSWISADDIVLVARCGANDLLIDAQADLLAVAAKNDVNGPPDYDVISFTANPSQLYENDASVIEMQTVQYDIQNNAAGVPALFRQEFNQAPAEVVEGIEDMQILFGIDTNGPDANGNLYATQYVPAAANVDFTTVVAVRVQLLVRSSATNVTDEAQNYTFNGVPVTAPDRRLRQVFTSTIAIRNRVGQS